MSLNLYVALLCPQTLLVSHFQHINCGKTLKRMDITFQNGSYFGLFTRWGIITAMENDRICCMNLRKMLLFVAVTYDASLKIYREQIRFQLGWKYFWMNLIAIYITLLIVLGFQIMVLYTYLDMVL